MPQQVSALKIWMSGHVSCIIFASSFQNKVNVFFEVRNEGHFPNWMKTTSCFTSSNASCYLLL